MQYFAGVPCPDDVLISTEDSDSWTWYPRDRWVYDKVAVALSQDLEAAPHGKVKSRVKAVAHLRMTSAAAVNLRDTLNNALLIGTSAKKPEGKGN